MCAMSNKNNQKEKKKFEWSSRKEKKKNIEICKVKFQTTLNNNYLQMKQKHNVNNKTKKLCEVLL